MCIEGDKQAYEQWESEWKADDENQGCGFDDIGEGMIYIHSKYSFHGGFHYLMDTVERRIYYLAGLTAFDLGFEREDVDWDNVAQLSKTSSTYQADHLCARYCFGMSAFEDGIAKVNWGITPDPMYYADSDGFGMEGDEVILSAFIDRHCRVLVKFQAMETMEKEEQCRRLALSRLNEEE